MWILNFIERGLFSPDGLTSSINGNGQENNLFSSTSINTTTNAGTAPMFMKNATTISWENNKINSNNPNPNYTTTTITSNPHHKGH